MTAATVIGAFLFGWPSIIAVIINYVKRRRGARAPGSSRTSAGRSARSGSACSGCALGGVLFITLVGIPIALGLWLGAGLWAIYRIVRGWLALRDRRPVP